MSKRLTHVAIARALGVSEATVSYWKKQGCPVHLPIAAIKAWRQDFLATNARAAEPPASPRQGEPAGDPQLATLRKALLAERLRYEQERRQLTALLRQEKEKSLVPIEEARKLVAKLAERATAHALNIPRQAARSFVGVKTELAAEKKLEDLVRQILIAMAKAGEGS